MTISILNYGLGNISSITNMIQKAGGRASLCNKPSDLLNAEKIILPGVGAFDYGMQRLNDEAWIDTLNFMVMERKTPILGICLGMQLMCLSSEEGLLPGLSWINAKVKRFKSPQIDGYKVPHMGWNIAKMAQENALFQDNGLEQRFYFVHSFYVDCYEPQDIVLQTYHGNEFVSGFQKDNIFGVQFHPEKSHRFGLSLMKNFIEYAC
ncbi:MAG: imidazole glycerol phosphate synthase subunit HisH [Gammaproteobacteria bacterium]|nr:imidazole glycerol phosphate synthase subunit HisH [Gammaproteobacteria bacterium]